MGLFRDIFKINLGTEIFKSVSMANNQADFGRVLEKKGIELAHEMKDLDKLERALKLHIQNRLAEEIEKDEEKALKLIDEIIKNEDLAIGSSIKITKLLVRVLREMFKQDILIEKYGFEEEVAHRLEEEIEDRIAKFSSELNRVGKIFVNAAKRTRKKRRLK